MQSAIDSHEANPPKRNVQSARTTALRGVRPRRLGSELPAVLRRQSRGVARAGAGSFATWELEEEFGTVFC